MPNKIQGAMSDHDHTDEEYRQLFEKWGVTKVRKMAQSGHYDAEMRRPMLAWIEEKNARRRRIRQSAFFAGLILFFVVLFVLVLEAGRPGGR